ncbi:MAG: arylesterase [Boseongicola sp. SB0673_bin_14]|nr:arylesterase [Boseongicola sp. SB0667_bin_21]MYI69242.1 arylesterase [Boseongicola sp. SB0673_bin_14]
MRVVRNAGIATFLFVGTAWAAPATVAAFGDSLIQGYGLAPDHGFVPQLQQWLDMRGANAELINAGVSGDTTAGGLSRIAWTLSDDVDALIVALGANDMLRGIDPVVARANLDGILLEAGRQDVPVLLIGMDALPNYGPEYEHAFNAIYPDLAAKHGVLYHPDFLGALAALGDRAAALEAYMQPDGMHPNRDGVKIIVADIGPSVLDLLGEID